MKMVKTLLVLAAVVTASLQVGAQTAAPEATALRGASARAGLSLASSMKVWQSPLYQLAKQPDAYSVVGVAGGSEDAKPASLLIACSTPALPVCSAAIFCSLNGGVCSAGIVCSANAGACSAGVVCSANAGVCSGGVACSASAGVCSVSGTGCSVSAVNCSVSGAACSVSGGACSGPF